MKKTDWTDDLLEGLSNMGKAEPGNGSFDQIRKKIYSPPPRNNWWLAAAVLAFFLISNIFAISRYMEGQKQTNTTALAEYIYFGNSLNLYQND